MLIMISAAFGISEAMVQSGAADLVAKALMGLAGKTIVSSSIIPFNLNYCKQHA